MALREITKFTCPNCGGYKYGTDGSAGPVETWIGHCQSDFINCHFSWPRTEDDKYFTGTGHFEDDGPLEGISGVAIARTPGPVPEA